MVRAAADRATEQRFEVMGTRAHVVVTGGDLAMLARACDRLAGLEARWSRFREDSELCRLNRHAGHPVVVSPITFRLMSHACAAWRRTGGRFDPTVLGAVVAEGYDRDYRSLPEVVPDTGVADAAPTPGCGAIELDPVVCSVRLPAGVAIDLGGIAKGFAADLVAIELLDDGARGACVNLGGDLRVVGEPPDGDAWVIAIDAEVPDALMPTLSLAAGAVATSSRTRRAWRRGHRPVHHLIDPSTGRAADVRAVAATVIAGQAVDAEPLAKAVLLDRSLHGARQLLAATGACGLVVDGDGSWTGVGPIDAFLRS